MNLTEFKLIFIDFDVAIIMACWAELSNSGWVKPERDNEDSNVNKGWSALKEGLGVGIREGMGLGNGLGLGLGIREGMGLGLGLGMEEEDDGE